MAVIGRGGLGHHEGCATHALRPARDDQIALAALDLARARDHRIHARGTEPVDRVGGHALGQAREQHHHARKVAVVLARLIGRTHHHLIERAPVKPGMARHERLHGVRGQIVGAHRRQRAAIAAYGAADIVADKDAGHRRCAVASISTSASSSIRPATTTMDMAGKCRPNTSR